MFGNTFVPSSPPAAIHREVLTAARTYYVRTDGNDLNNGLTSTAGGAFKTIQKAIDVIASTLDIAGNIVTVWIADGTYTGAVVLKNVVGYAAPGNLVIKGNNSTPANVVISNTGTCVSVASIPAVWDILDLKITSSGNIGIYCLSAYVRFGNVNFGGCPVHMYCSSGGTIECIGNYFISGNAANHWYAILHGNIIAAGRTITFSNSPVISENFAAMFGGFFLINAMTFTNGGTVTGKRYAVEGNGVIFTGGGGAAYIPGTIAGTASTGGQYI